MAKYSEDDILDAGLQYIIDECDGLTVCTSDVTTASVPDYTKVSSTSALIAVHTMASGDFTIADGDVSGRKVTIAAQNDLPITTTGTAEHICLIDTVGSVVLYMTTCTAQSLTSGNNVSVPAWDIELRDPA